MKKILLIGLLSFSFLAFAQKKELRKAAKLLDQNFYNEALDALSQIESMIDGTDQKYQAQYSYLKGWALKEDSKLNGSVVSFPHPWKNKIGIKSNTKYFNRILIH